MGTKELWGRLFPSAVSYFHEVLLFFTFFLGTTEDEVWHTLSTTIFGYSPNIIICNSSFTTQIQQCGPAQWGTALEALHLVLNSVLVSHADMQVRGFFLFIHFFDLAAGEMWSIGVGGLPLDAD